MTVEPFPLHKGLEKYLRDLEDEASRINELSLQVKALVENWEDRYIKLGAEYVAAGGKDEKLLENIWTVTKTKEIFGIFT
jgi:hypothetical protein